jgi:hypothetical protein
MSCGRRLVRVLFTGVLLLAGLAALSATPASAETSYHKLKKRLHRVEHDTGQALQDAGAALVEGLGEITIEFDGDGTEDDGGAARCHAPKARKGQPATTPVRSEKAKGAR